MILTVISIFISYNVFFRNNEVYALSKYGSRGEEVRQIQTKLKRWGYYKGNVDGIFGSGTLEAVKWFQRKNGLQVDGIAGKIMTMPGLPKIPAAEKIDLDEDGNIVGIF